MITITTQDIAKYRSVLTNQNILADLDVIEACEGDLMRSVRVLARRAGASDERSVSKWFDSALQAVRQVVCEEEFKDGLIPGLMGVVTGSLIATNDPVLSAIATPVAIYISQIGIKKFCTDLKVSNN